MTEKELLKLKKKVDTAAQEEQQLKGEMKAILANLKEDFNCASIEEAKEQRKKLKKQMEKLSEKIDGKLVEINEQYLPDEEP